MPIAVQINTELAYMNRSKEEEKRKHDEARKGLSDDEIISLDLEDAINFRLTDLARTIHSQKFPEEGDFVYDSISDANDRNRGANPMSQEYIEKIRGKRDELGVSQLSENGSSVFMGSYNLCLEEAKAQIYSDMNLSRPPAKTCVFCDKSIKEIGGKRLAAQNFRGVMLSKKKVGGGNKNCPHKCIVLFSEPLVYMDFWGTPLEWTQTAIDSASKSFLNGQRPWFCQVCGQRKCRQCGSPENYPMASEILSCDGNTSHAGIFPFDPGCINLVCGKYKEWPGKQEVVFDLIET